jgi:hypothetical protein
MKTEIASKRQDATTLVETRIGDLNSALDEMIDHAIVGIMQMSNLCTGKQTDVTQVSVTDVTVIQATGNFMDAGRGERKAITQAGLTLTCSSLTHI